MSATVTVEVTPEKRALLKILDDAILRGHSEVTIKIRDFKVQAVDELVKHRF